MTTPLMRWALLLAAGLVLAAPVTAQTGLVVVAVQAGQLTLSWGDTSATETGFTIERSAPNDVCEFLPVGTVPADTETWVDAPLAPGARWCYRVRAVDEAGTSAPSNVACGTVADAPPTTADAPPTTATATFTRTRTFSGPYSVALDPYTCTRIQGGAPEARITQGATVLGRVALVNPHANPPKGVPFTLTCTRTPTTVTLALDGVLTLTVPR